MLFFIAVNDKLNCLTKGSNKMSKLDRKLEKYAIPNLSLIMVLCYGAGFIISMLAPGLVSFLTLNPYLILRGEIWRLVTWILIPGQQFDLWSIIMILFYYSIGRTLEQIWGDYLYNKYIFSGILFTVLGSVILFIAAITLQHYTWGSEELYAVMQGYGTFFSAYFVFMSIFLGFACTFPDTRVLLMFIFPIKMKWLGIAYSVYYLYEIVTYIIYGFQYSPLYFALVVAIFSSLMNFLVFFVTSQIKRKGSPRVRVKQVQRQHQFNQDIKSAAPKTGMAKHKCAICGRTEVSNPELLFRFCSKCNGNYEYCDAHIFNHTHVE